MPDKDEKEKEKNQGAKVAGIIAEYNPFHNGHEYHLRKARELTGAQYVVAVMSGNFLQRGEPAICSKWTRAKAAVKNGVDVVLELPFAFACNSAEYFSYGAVSILDKLGCVSHLAFGSECGRIEELFGIARVLACESDSFKDNIRKNLDRGLSYPKARYEALSEEPDIGHATSIIQKPNNILAVEYIKQLILQGSDMVPVPVHRAGTGYNDTQFSGNMASATAIRKAVMQSAAKMAGDGFSRAMMTENVTPSFSDGASKQWPKWLSPIEEVIPDVTMQVLADDCDMPFMPDMLFNAIRYKIMSTPTHSIAESFSVGEGLENRMIKAVIKARSYEELIDAIVSKRYTRTRIKRSLIHLLMNFTAHDMADIMKDTEKYLYARVLAASPDGRRLLSRIKKDERCRIPVYTNVNRQADKDSPGMRLLKMDILAADVYNIMQGKDIYSQSDLVMKPYIRTR